MARLDFNRVLLIAIVGVSLGVVAGLAIVLVQRLRTQHLTLAAGSPSGESYILRNALKRLSSGITLKFESPFSKLAEL